MGEINYHGGRNLEEFVFGELSDSMGSGYGARVDKYTFHELNNYDKLELGDSGQLVFWEDQNSGKAAVGYIYQELEEDEHGMQPAIMDIRAVGDTVGIKEMLGGEHEQRKRLVNEAADPEPEEDFALVALPGGNEVHVDPDYRDPFEGIDSVYTEHSELHSTNPRDDSEASGAEAL